MSWTIATDDSLTGGGSLSDPDLGSSQFAAFGRGALPPVRTRYSYGTGDYEVNAWYVAKRTIANGAFDNINLSSLPVLGSTFSLTKLKRLFVGIFSPDGVKSLRVGPQNQLHANALWFAVTSANFYETVWTSILKDNPFAGWDVAAGATDVLSVFNPGADPLDYGLWLLGLD